MKWYYEWRLKRVRAEISALKEATQVRLLDDYTGHSRLRVLDRVASNLQQRLAKYGMHSPAATPATVPEVTPKDLNPAEFDLKEAVVNNPTQ